MFLLLLLIAITLPLLLSKVIIKLTTGRDSSYACLLGKTVIVTGANTGIGLYTAMEFAKRGARVILACRDEQRAEKARQEIIKQTDNSNVVFKHLDLSSLESVKKFADDIKATEEHVHILVNNAGLAGIGQKQTADGFDMTMQVNYFGPFLLTMLLLKKLNATGETRIVNVSSMAAAFSDLDPKKLNQYPRDMSLIANTKMYSHTKLCNILFTMALADRLKNTSVTVNSLHPGAVKTELHRQAPAWFRYIYECFMLIFFKNTEEGAQTSIYVALSKELRGVNGCYFSDCKKRDTSHYATKELAEQIWTSTVELLKQDELIKEYVKSGTINRS